MVGLALLCLAAFAGDRFVLSPMLAGWKARAARSAALRQELERGQQLLDREATLAARWRELQARSLPANPAAAEFAVLSALGEWASAGRLKITDVKPRWVREKNLPARLEIRLSAAGGLPAITQFLYALEQAPMALRLERVELRARDAQGGDLALEARLSGLVLAEDAS